MNCNLAALNSSDLDDPRRRSPGLSEVAALGPMRLEHVLNPRALIRSDNVRSTSIQNNLPIVYFLAFPPLASIASFKVPSHCSATGRLDETQVQMCGTPVVPALGLSFLIVERESA